MGPRWGPRPISSSRCLPVLAVLAAIVGLVAAPSARAGEVGVTACSAAVTSGPTRAGRIGGIVRPAAIHGRSGCHYSQAARLSDGPAPGGSPPLTFHGGRVMGTPSVGDKVTVTPIFWAPGGGYTFDSTYKTFIETYLANVAADSAKTTNVFSTLFEWSGSNGTVNYKIAVHPSIDDGDAFPTAGCTADTGQIYSDTTGYSICLTDAQLQTEINNVINANGLPRDLGHLYLLMLPKGVESCYPDPTAGLDCSINTKGVTGQHSSFCAYHSAFGSGLNTIYANMPFPIYASPTTQTCGSDAGFDMLQNPNGSTNLNGDVEVSPLSHEMAEAMSDPDLNAWYDAKYFENGDECAYTYGATSGITDGSYYNQVINGHDYLTQEEFSNAHYDSLSGLGGCIQAYDPVVPAVTGVSPAAGPMAGRTVTVSGTGFPGVTGVDVGGQPATSISLIDANKLSVTVPPGASPGPVDVTVTNGAGTSALSNADTFTYDPQPTVSAVSPRSGPKGGGQLITVTGTGFVSGVKVSVGGSAATSVSLVSATKLTARTPAHSPATVDVHVTTPGGTSATSTADHYTYLDKPTVTGLSPTSGPHGGGQTVVITGAHFVKGAQVRFGTKAATSVTFVSGTKLKVRTPSHAVGTVYVLVTTPGGTSAAVTAARYKFL